MVALLSWRLWQVAVIVALPSCCHGALASCCHGSLAELLSWWLWQIAVMVSLTSCCHGAISNMLSLVALAGNCCDVLGALLL